jgi:putative spermidine/putrescine transport system substrate-binding protein
MLARSLVAAAAMLVLCCAQAAARDLSVMVRSLSQDTISQVFVQPFSAATGVIAQTSPWDGGIETLRTQAKAPGNTWDLVLVDGDELATGCTDNLFEKLDWSAIGGKDHYLPQAVSDCGVGASVATTVLAWDRDKFPAAPGWSDFWDVAKYPGKRGLRRGARGNLEFALIADGVSVGDVYKVLSTSEGVDRAFRKLDQLKPYIVWWDDDAEAAHILASGDVLMTSASAPAITTINRIEHRNFGVQWTASLYEVLSWVIMKGSTNLRSATQFLYFAGSSAVEGRLVLVSGDGGLAKGSSDWPTPDAAQNSPTAPANLSAGIRIDVSFWHDNLPRLRQRFDGWLTRQ